MRALLCLALLAACRRPPPPVPQPPRVEASGCDAVTIDGRCEIVDGQEVRLVTETGFTKLTPANDPRFAATTRPVWLRKANLLRKSGKTDDAAKIAAAHADEPGIMGARAAGLNARLALASGRTDEAITLFRRSIPVLAAAGRISEEADDRFAASWALSQVLLRFDEARAILDEGIGHIRAFPDGRAREPYYRALVATRAGDLRGGLALLAENKRAAERFGLATDARDAEEAIANALFSIGRRVEAARRLRALEETSASDSPCRRADRLVNLAQTEISSESALATLDRALALGCTGGWRNRNIHVDLGRVKLDLGRVADARAELSTARTLGAPPTWLVVAELDLEGRLALTDGRPRDALVLFAREEILARAGSIVDALWRSHVSIAAAHEALGHDDLARDSYLAAEDVLDEAAILVPLGEGRAILSLSRDRGTRGLIELLIRKNVPADAFSVVRRVQARARHGVVAASEIASLDPSRRVRFERAVADYRRARLAIEASASGDWSLDDKALAVRRSERTAQERAARAALESAVSVLGHTRSALPPLAIDEDTAVLAFHAAGTGFVALVATRSGVTARRVAVVALAPIADLLKVKRVRVLSTAATDALDLHALDLDGAPLITRRSVDYMLDLAPVPEGSGTLVIAADPDGNLPAARAEGDAIAQLYPAATRLWQAAVTAEALTRAFRGARLFHFAGHARLGDGALEAALSLANGGRLTVADVLALEHVPGMVVLSACDAAHTTALSEGLGLAQAFVIAGARAAIAPTRPVSDALAAELSLELHRAFGDPVIALAQTLRALRTRKPAEDWAAFRVVTR